MKLYCLVMLVHVVFCVSCNSSFNKEEIRVLIRDIEENNSLLDQSSKDIESSIESLSVKIETKDKALFWNEKRIKADSLTNIYINKLQSLDIKNALTKNQIAKDLLKLYNDIKQVDSSLNKEFKYVFSDSFREIPIQNFDLYKMFFINKAKIIRNNYFELCHKQIYYVGGCGYEKFQAIANQNSTHFKPNEALEIIAGIAQFNYQTKTEVFIDDKKISTDFDGISKYKINVGNKKGKFSKKVTVTFTKPDGKIDTIQKYIRYSVD